MNAARQGSLPWSAEHRAAAEQLVPSLAAASPERLWAAVALQAADRLEAARRGIEAYRRHPYRRSVRDEPEIVWRQGSTRLRDFGGSGAPVLVVPSLVNRWFVLHLSERRSFLRLLKARGFRPLAVDWDAPGPAEREFGTAEYVAVRLEAVLDAVLARTGEAPHLLGYCMGGNLTLALALRRQRDLRSLGLLATPWDFHAGRPAIAVLMGNARKSIGGILDAYGEMPLDFLQSFFLALDPTLSDRKFRRFAAMPQDSDAARDFVALEDWLNEGTALTKRTAEDCLFGWYGENLTARRRWQVGGHAVDPRALDLPSLAVVPGTDRIVPPESARALAAEIPGCQVHVPPLGHIGMMVSNATESQLVEPVAAFLTAAKPRRPRSPRAIRAKRAAAAS
ncbi:MAG: alpha/beta hydrolase [Alphaproteobacteria bacterium]|nr:alpha/beta hydrolase [Alphaproteobacteria bacterium]